MEILSRGKNVMIHLESVISGGMFWVVFFFTVPKLRLTVKMSTYACAQFTFIIIDTFNARIFYQ